MRGAPSSRTEPVKAGPSRPSVPVRPTRPCGTERLRRDRCSCRAAVSSEASPCNCTGPRPAGRRPRREGVMVRGKVLHTRGHAEEPGLGIQGQGPGQRTPGGEQIIGEIAAQDGVLTVAQVLYRKVDVAQVVALAALLHMQAALAQGQAAQLQRQEHLAAGLVTGGITGGRIRRRGGLAFRQQQTQRRAVQTDFADDQLPRAAAVPAPDGPRRPWP